MLHPTYPIETDRLVLRPFEHGDLDALHAYYGRADVARYLLWAAHDRERTRSTLRRKISEHRLHSEGDSLSLAVLARETGILVGDVVLVWHSREHRQGEVGFVFNPDFQGCGYATEAAAAVLRLGFESLGLHRITGHCDARNGASARLMGRLGMRREAHFSHNRTVKGEWAEELVYAIRDDEWS